MEYKERFREFLHNLHVLTSDLSAYQTVTHTDSTSEAHQGLKSPQEREYRLAAL